MTVLAGPFALSIERLFFFIGFGLALLVVWLVGRRQQIAVEPVLTRMLFFGFISARVAFILLYLEDYLRHPLSIIDIRDGGFLYEVGVLVAVAIGAFAWRERRLRKPLGSGIAAGLLTWGIAVGSLALMQAVQPTLRELPLNELTGEAAKLEHLEGKPVV